MSLEGKYMIAFTKGMDVEEYEGPGSVVEHEMELHISAPGVIEGTLAGRGGGSRQFTGTLVGNRFEFTVQGGHGGHDCGRWNRRGHHDLYRPL